MAQVKAQVNVTQNFSLQDPGSTASYTAHLLRKLQEHAEGVGGKTAKIEEEQCELGRSISLLAEDLTGFDTVKLDAIPRLLSLQPLRLADALFPEAIPEDGSSKAGEDGADNDNPFIYTPLKVLHMHASKSGILTMNGQQFQHKKNKQETIPDLQWVQGSIGHILVNLCNPYPFPIFIESIMARLATKTKTQNHKNRKQMLQLYWRWLSSIPTVTYAATKDSIHECTFARQTFRSWNTPHPCLSNAPLQLALGISY